jgi:hypothetical protein
MRGDALVINRFWESRGAEAAKAEETAGQGTSTERFLNLLGNLERQATFLEALRNSFGAEL